MTVANSIHTRLAAAFTDGQVQVHDPMQDDTHLQAVIISPQFHGKNRVQRHRLVYAALGDAFDSNFLHALQLQTLTPEESPT